MDDLDAIIIAALTKDGRASNANIARAAGVVEGTVRRRLRRLIDEGYIYVAAIPNPEMTGDAIEALIGVQAYAAMVDEVANRLAQMEQVAWMSVSTGPYDVLVWARAASADALNEFLRAEVGALPGVQRTEAFVSLGVKKRSYGVIV